MTRRTSTSNQGFNCAGSLGIRLVRWPLSLNVGKVYGAIVPIYFDGWVLAFVWYLGEPSETDSSRARRCSLGEVRDLLEKSCGQDEITLVFSGNSEPLHCRTTGNIASVTQDDAGSTTIVGIVIENGTPIALYTSNTSEFSFRGDTNPALQVDRTYEPATSPYTEPGMNSGKCSVQVSHDASSRLDND